MYKITGTDFEINISSGQIVSVGKFFETGGSNLSYYVSLSSRNRIKLSEADYTALCALVSNPYTITGNDYEVVLSCDNAPLLESFWDASNNKSYYCTLDNQTRISITAEQYNSIIGKL